MILGTSAKAPSRLAPTADTTPARPVNTTNENVTRRTQARTLSQLILPQTTVDRFTLCQLVAADLIVLVAVCGALSLFSPAWGLPWAYLPIFAVLVTLFGFCEGLYKRAGDPSPAGIVPALARSTLFAIGLVFIAAWDEMRPLAAARIFASSLAGLALLRRLRQMEWKRRRRETESRKILIIGGGPVARSVARALRNDPLQRATVCGFVDDDLPLSPAVLGRIEDLDWLAAPNSSMRSSSLSPVRPPRREKRPRLRFAITWTFVLCPICPRVRGQTQALIASEKCRSLLFIANHRPAPPYF